MTVTTEVEHITPDIANEWLVANVDNRDIDQQRVKLYARDMQHGRWQLNGEAIKFNGTELIDGQHRLLAVVLANATIRSLVVRGLATSAKSTLDSGKNRSLKDVLGFRGEVDRSNLAAALGWLHKFETGAERWGTAQMTKGDAILLLERHPGIRDVGPIVQPLRKENLIPRGLAWALAYRFTQIDQDAGIDFFRKLASGANLAEGHPILQLRQWLIGSHSANRRRSGVRPYVTLGMVLKTWNLYRDGRTVRSLAFRATGANAEQLPIPR